MEKVIEFMVDYADRFFAGDALVIEIVKVCGAWLLSAVVIALIAVPLIGCILMLVAGIIYDISDKIKSRKEWANTAKYYEVWSIRESGELGLCMCDGSASKCTAYIRKHLQDGPKGYSLALVPVKEDD